MNIDKTIYSITEVNQYIKIKFSSDPLLKQLFIKGEISNLKYYPSGHVYFSLIDKDSSISCVMFSTYAKKLQFPLNNGDEIIALCSIDVFIGRGQYQAQVYSIDQYGKGNALLELEKLKQKLYKEGLFDESKKRKINLFPNSIGVITAINGAAIRDILTNLKRRYPIADIFVFPSLVQGEQAPASLLKAFLKSQEYHLDTLIIGRGGGASEDLSAFNDETLVRAIAKRNCAVISAVGHEIDFTLVDYVADKRASTPTAAAELSCISVEEIIQRLDLYSTNLSLGLTNKVDTMKQTLDDLTIDINETILNKFSLYQDKLTSYQNVLKALNPHNILDRGYSITTSKDGKIIKSIKDIAKNDQICTSFKDGVIISEVKETKNGRKN